MAEVKATPTIVHGAAPVEPLPITPERYLSPTYMQREADNMWPRMWLFACLERDVANVGDFYSFPNSSLFSFCRGGFDCGLRSSDCDGSGTTNSRHLC